MSNPGEVWRWWVVLVPALALAHACKRSPFAAADASDAANAADVANVTDVANTTDVANVADAVDAPDAAADVAACALGGGVQISPQITLAVLPAGQSQMVADVAFDGTNYLVIWQQGPASGAAWQTFGARVTRDGTVLDSPPLQLNGAGGSKVAFNGTDFVLAWSESRNGSYHLYAARVTSLGAVRDPGGIRIDTMASGSYAGSLACGRSGCLVSWESGGGTFVSRLDASLVALDVPPLSVAPGALTLSSSVAALAAGFFVAWNDSLDSTFGGAFVGPGGGLVGSAVKLAPNGYGIPPAVSSDGTTAFVVWAASDEVSYTGVYGARVGAGATALDPAGIAIAGPSAVQPYLAVAYDGRQFVAVWQGAGYVLTGARVSSAGAVLDSPGFALTGNEHELAPRIASAGDGTALIVYDHALPRDADTFVDYSVRASFITTCVRP